MFEFLVPFINKLLHAYIYWNYKVHSEGTQTLRPEATKWSEGTLPTDTELWIRYLWYVCVGKTWSRLLKRWTEMLLSFFKLLNKEFAFFIAGILHFKQNSIMQIPCAPKCQVAKLRANKYLEFLKSDYYMIS